MRDILWRAHSGDAPPNLQVLSSRQGYCVLDYFPILEVEGWQRISLDSTNRSHFFCAGSKGSSACWWNAGHRPAHPYTSTSLVW